MEGISGIWEVDGEEACKELYDILGPPIQRTATQIFESYWPTLLQASIGEIVKAVWGSQASGGLSKFVEGINREVRIAVDDIMRSLQVAGVSSTRERVITIMIHELIAWRLLYMVEAMRHGLHGMEIMPQTKNLVSYN